MNIKETFNNKKFFIVGVGGSGMSSIAKYLTESGAIVFGYDQRKSLVTNQLLKLGIKVTHDIDFEIEKDTLVITSSAINDENSLVQKARLQGLSIINRPEFLSNLTSQYKTIGIAGTHGKTTTTALLSHIYQYNNINHSYIYGGMTSFSGIGGHCGDSSSLVIEADEAFRTFINFDLNDISQVKDSAKQILNEVNKIDVLINNAGIIDTSLFQMTKIAKIKQIFDINFFSQLEFTQIIIKKMLKNKGSSIINISSTAALDPVQGRIAYSASKSALISFSQILSKELSKFNIRVNVIAPGLVDTDLMHESHSEEYVERVIMKDSLRRMHVPSHVTRDIPTRALPEMISHYGHEICI